MERPIPRFRTQTEILASPTVQPVPAWLQHVDGQWVRDCVQILIASLLIAGFLLTFVVQPTRVNGISMQPMVNPGQRLVMEKVSYLVEPPQQGDIVVIEGSASAATLIKRVIATPGDTVEIHDGVVYVNGQTLPQSYNNYTADSLRPTEIPDGHIFVLGDNRAHSNDSRAFGVVAESDILGQAVFSYYPLDSFGFLQ